MTSAIKLCKIGKEFSIVDNNGNIIVRNIQNIDEYNVGNNRFIRFMTSENEFSCIDSFGLFFGKFSFRKYDMVYALVPGSIYKIRKNRKYGIIDSFDEKELVTCIFDEIDFLRSNIFDGGDIIKLRKNNKFSLVHYSCINTDYEEYDYIYTPIQPLNKFIVYLNGKYGFINVTTFEKIIEPTFESVEELCNHYKCNVDKYTKDLFQTNIKIKLKSVVDIERCCSSIIDTNKILKGKWGGNKVLKSDCRLGENYVYSLFYSPMNEQLPINMYGYFYNLFDCRVYNVVIHAIDNLYIAVKDDEKYGLIDDEFNVVLDFCYNDIRLVHFSQIKDKALFVITYGSKQFLYNAGTGIKSSMYDSLSCWDINSGFYKNYLIYEENGKYGLLSPEGYVMTKARFELCKSRGKYESAHANFREIFHGREYRFYIDSNKFYGEVPIEQYDSCIRIITMDSFCYYYIIKVEGKYGLLNKRCEEIDMPKLDNIISIKNLNFGGTYFYENPVPEIFLIGYINNKYCLYSILSIMSKNAILIIGDCEKMEMIEDEGDFSHKYKRFYVRFEKKGNEGYVNENGEIISTDIFDEIKPFKDTCYCLIYKNGKAGLLDSSKKTLLPCIYDEIVEVSWPYVKVVEDGMEREVRLHVNCIDKSSYVEKDSCHYTIYSGSYAQDEMGYSDEDIDTIFDGEPDAYWNID